MPTTRIACHQLAPVVGDLDGNRERSLAAIEAEKIGPRLAGDEVYTDDLAPVEWLIDRSILGYAGDEG